ncbi:MAG: hypothetical protein AAFR61_20090 [Bacteroidota bacterium]
MASLYSVSPLVWASGILISATLFSAFWFLDALTHKELVKVDITDRELQTHRNILATSMLMELSLVLMYFWSWEILPLFLAFFITRTAHEFIDELHFHVGRCTPFETTLHLVMWVTVLSKTGFMFMWGFFTNYAGIWELPVFYYVWAVLAFGSMGLTSLAEWKR